MVISIGYAACHWCHVMEHESFEDSTVATVMNQHFISIKVDREERPDVDQIYINAVQLMTGSAGWPLNVITLPDGRPVWGGTYFRKNEWINALERLQEIYETDPQKLVTYADRLEEGIKSMDLIERNTENKDLKAFDTETIVKKWSNSFDYKYGGYKQAPKFMMASNYNFMLRHAVQSQNQNLLDYVTLTLDKMAYGGLFDQMGGGFSRYSTDSKWHVPHFEKMLYDNAQLVSLYSDAYAATKNPIYKKIVEETLEFVAREMTNIEGGFYSSLDADSNNEEGKLEEGAYYVFTKDELQKIIIEDFPIFEEYYNINNYGKWEKDKYVLIRDKSDAEISKQYSISEKKLQEKNLSWKRKLLEYRNKRDRPRLDDKTLTSWNALMLKGYVDAYKVFWKKEYLEAAIKNANFIATKQLQENGALWHNYKDGQSSITGYLEDYASVIQAYIALYEITLDDEWLQLSKELTDYTFQHFYDEDKGMFYFTSNNSEILISRTYEYRDNVIPSSNSIIANNLFLLAHYFDEPKYEETAQQMLRNVLTEMQSYPSSFSNWLSLLENYQSNFYEVVVVGPDAIQKAADINREYIPNKLVAGSIKEKQSPLLQNRFVEDKTLFYICENNTCKLPVEDVKIALQSLKN